VLPGDWLKNGKPKRRVDLDPLGTHKGKYPSRKHHRTPEEARAFEARDAFSDEELDYPKMTLGEVVAGIKDNLVAERDKAKLAAESAAAESASDSDDDADAVDYRRRAFASGPRPPRFV